MHTPYLVYGVRDAPFKMIEASFLEAQGITIFVAAGRGGAPRAVYGCAVSARQVLRARDNRVPGMAAVEEFARRFGFRKPRLRPALGLINGDEDTRILAQLREYVPIEVTTPPASDWSTDPDTQDDDYSESAGSRASRGSRGGLPGSVTTSTTTEEDAPAAHA